MAIIAGFIKVPNDFDLFDRTNLFLLYMAQKANYADGEYNGITLKRGQLVRGRKQLSIETTYTEDEVRGCLKKLVKSGDIFLEATNKYTKITVLTYNKFHGKSNESSQVITPQQKNDINNSESIDCTGNTNQNPQQEGEIPNKIPNKTEKTPQQIPQQNNEINHLESTSSEPYNNTIPQQNPQQNREKPPTNSPLLKKNNKEEEKNINTIPSGISNDFFKNFSRPVDCPTWPEAAEEFMKADGFIRELRRKYPEWDKNKMLTTMKKWLMELNDQEGQKKLPGLIEHFRNKVAKVERESTDAEFLSKLDEIGVKKVYKGGAKKLTALDTRRDIEVATNYEDMLSKFVSQRSIK